LAAGGAVTNGATTTFLVAGADAVGKCAVGNGEERAANKGEVAQSNIIKRAMKRCIGK
jgi:hypothetical protein